MAYFNFLPQIFGEVSFLGYTFRYIVIRMDVRILRISPIGTDFLSQKSVPIGEIRKIRTSIRITICNLKMKPPKICGKKYSFYLRAFQITSATPKSFPNLRPKTNK
jgi:hypothetical protein